MVVQFAQLYPDSYRLFELEVLSSLQNHSIENEEASDWLNKVETVDFWINFLAKKSKDDKLARQEVFCVEVLTRYIAAQEKILTSEALYQSNGELIERISVRLHSTPRNTEEFICWQQMMLTLMRMCFESERYFLQGGRTLYSAWLA